MYNSLFTEFECGECGWSGTGEMQFKYGNLRRNEYVIGSKIIWGRVQVGESVETAVVADAVAICPRCHAMHDCDIFIRNGQIVRAERSTGAYDYVHGEGFYVILEK